MWLGAVTGALRTVESNLPTAMPAAMPAGVRLKWALVGWSAGFLASVAGAIMVMAAAGFDNSDDMAADLGLGWLLLLQIPLWFGLLGTPLLARRRGLNWSEQLGWRIKPVDVPLGIAVGLGLQLVVLPVLYWPILQVFDDLDVEAPARELVDLADSSWGFAALLAMTVIAAPLTEEIFFRGLLQGALRDRLGATAALVISSLAFAVVHFQALQFPALLVIAVAHAVLVQRTGRIAAALCSHVAFNALTVVALASLS